MSEKDIDISLSGDMLLLKGEKHQEREEKTENRYLSERNYGTFQRNFVLPDGVDRDQITAEFAKEGSDADPAENPGSPEAAEED